MKKLSIKKVVRDSKNNIIGYELSSGSIVDVDEAIHMAMNNNLSNVSMIYRNESDGEIKGIGIDTSKLPEIK